jgi:hypothetical protein
MVPPPVVLAAVTAAMSAAELHGTDAAVEA